VERGADRAAASAEGERPTDPANTKPSLCGDAVDAPERIRTTTDHAVHKALNLGGRPALRVRSRLLERFQLQLRTVSLKLGPPIGPLGNGAPQRAVTETVARARCEDLGSCHETGMSRTRRRAVVMAPVKRP